MWWCYRRVPRGNSGWWRKFRGRGGPRRLPRVPCPVGGRVCLLGSACLRSLQLRRPCCRRRCCPPLLCHASLVVRRRRCCAVVLLVASCRYRLLLTCVIACLNRLFVLVSAINLFMIGLDGDGLHAVTLWCWRFLPCRCGCLHAALQCPAREGGRRLAPRSGMGVATWCRRPSGNWVTGTGRSVAVAAATRIAVASTAGSSAVFDKVRPEEAPSFASDAVRAAAPPPADCALAAGSSVPCGVIALVTGVVCVAPRIHIPMDVACHCPWG